MKERELRYEDLEPGVKKQISKEDFEELSKRIQELRETLKPLEDEALKKK